MAALVGCRRGAPLLARVLSIGRAFSSAPTNDGGAKQPEPPMVFSRSGASRRHPTPAAASIPRPPRISLPAQLSSFIPCFLFPYLAGDKKELRYYVLKGQTNPELALLESSVTGVPMPGPPGKRARSFKVPPPGVCNSILVRAAEVSGLVPRPKPSSSSAACEAHQQQHWWGRHAVTGCRTRRSCWPANPPSRMPPPTASCPAAES